MPLGKIQPLGKCNQYSSFSVPLRSRRPQALSILPSANILAIGILPKAFIYSMHNQFAGVTAIGALAYEALKETIMEV